jgi:hypothetical protein
MSGKSGWGDLVRRFSRRRLVAGALLAMPACGDECLRDKGFAEGTRFEVTVATRHSPPVKCST